MKQIILKKVEQQKHYRHICYGCVFMDGSCGCRVPLITEMIKDQCKIQGKFYIWVFDRIEDEKTN